jgi:D-3-phosphoglycerate dehydrogenase
VSYVNAPQLADERGVDVRETTTSHAQDYVNLISLRGGAHALAGTLSGLRAEPRIVMLDDHSIEVPPARHMIVVHNDDRPGVIGRVGSVLGDHGINISDMAVGRTKESAGAVMVLAVDDLPGPDVLERLRSADGVVSVSALT